MMNKKSIEYAVIKNAINILCVLCSAKSDIVIDVLTGYLWDEEEAGDIKRSSGKFKIEMGGDGE